MSIIDKLARALDGLKSNDLIGRYVLKLKFIVKSKNNLFKGLERKKNIVVLPLI